MTPAQKAGLIIGQTYYLKCDLPWAECKAGDSVIFTNDGGICAVFTLTKPNKRNKNIYIFANDVYSVMYNEADLLDLI